MGKLYYSTLVRTYSHVLVRMREYYCMRVYVIQYAIRVYIIRH